MVRHRTSLRTAVFFPALFIAAVSSGALFADTSSVVTPSTAPVASLEFVGASTCLNCHQNQEHFKDTVHARAFAQLKGIAFEKSCETCHGPGSLHAAAAGDRTNPGFSTIKNPKDLSAVDLDKTCLQCHADQNRLHWSGGRHEARHVSCLACHSVHAAQEDKLLLVKPTIEKVCAQCHQDMVAKIHRSAHMPVAEGKMDCTSCHNPHGSATDKMLIADSANDTCYSCHADKRGPFVWEHPPVRENCLNCHDPHGSHNEKMLVARLPFLCQRCHNGSGHPATPYDKTSITAQNARSLAGSCTACHPSVHGSNHPSGQYFTR
jgi:DmsE family decaheme c-type cytochrome